MQSWVRSLKNPEEKKDRFVLALSLSDGGPSIASATRSSGQVSRAIWTIGLSALCKGSLRTRATDPPPQPCSACLYPPCVPTRQVWLPCGLRGTFLLAPPTAPNGTDGELQRGQDKLNKEHFRMRNKGALEVQQGEVRCGCNYWVNGQTGDGFLRRRTWKGSETAQSLVRRASAATALTFSLTSVLTRRCFAAIVRSDRER